MADPLLVRVLRDLARLRDESGVTDVELAEHLGIWGEEQLYRFWRGEDDSLTLAGRIARALGVTIDVRITRLSAGGRGSQRALAGVERKLRAALSRPPDALERYRVGEIIAAVKREPARYGDDAIAALAAAVGEPVGNLYRFAKVAEAWSRAEVERLFARGLTWSHLVALVWRLEAKDRQRWLARVQRENLSVRALERLLKRNG